MLTNQHSTRLNFHTTILVFIAFFLQGLSMPTMYQSSFYNFSDGFFHACSSDADMQNIFLSTTSNYSVYQTNNSTSLSARYIPIITTATINYALMTRDGLLTVTYWTDTTIRVYNITGDEKVALTASIPLLGGFSYTFFTLSADGSYLAFANGTQVQIYKYDGSLYQFFAESHHPASINHLKMAPDGQFYSVVLANNDLAIYRNNPGLPILVDLINIGYLSKTTTMWGSKSTLGVYDLISSCNNLCLITIYLQFDGISLLVAQNILLSASQATGNNYMSFNGNYFVLTFASLATKIGRIFKKTNLGVYKLMMIITLPSLSYAVRMDENGDLLAFALVDSLMFFYSCNVANCMNCSWRNICSNCMSNFILVNNNTCTYCSGNDCSSLSNPAIDINSTSNSVSTTIETLKSQMTGLIIMVVLLALLIIIGFILFFYKIFKLSSALTTVNSIDTNRIQIPELSEKIENLIKDSHQIKEIESKVQLNDKSMETLQHKNQTLQLQDKSDLSLSQFNSQSLDNQFKMQPRRRKINTVHLNKVQKEEDQQMDIHQNN